MVFKSHSLSFWWLQNVFFKWKQSFMLAIIMEDCHHEAAFQRNWNRFNDKVIGREAVLLLFQFFSSRALKSARPHFTCVSAPTLIIFHILGLFWGHTKQNNNWKSASSTFHHLLAAVTNQFLFSFFWWFNFCDSLLFDYLSQLRIFMQKAN